MINSMLLFCDSTVAVYRYCSLRDIVTYMCALLQRQDCYKNPNACIATTVGITAALNDPIHKCKASSERI